MKKLLLLAGIATYALWSCGDGGADDPKAKTLCDSVTYTAMVKPILTASCNAAGCHSQGAGGVDLRTYNVARAATETGNLIKCINHEQGVPAMPQGKPKLSQRELDIFNCWKTKGYPQ